MRGGARGDAAGGPYFVLLDALPKADNSGGGGVLSQTWTALVLVCNYRAGGAFTIRAMRGSNFVRACIAAKCDRPRGSAAEQSVASNWHDAVGRARSTAIALRGT